MSVKTVSVDGIGTIKLVKSSRNRSIRLSVGSDGSIRVSMPYWTPFAAGISFARQHSSWIQAHSAKKAALLLSDGQKIGKLHHLNFLKVPTGETVSARVTATKIIVKYHSHESITDLLVQDRAERAVFRALKKETLQLLTPRVRDYALRHGFDYHSIASKQLKRRWGSCDSHGNLVFNLFLMQLPWELIDYVILHELTHTQHLHHGSAFWARLKEVCPYAEDLKRQIKTYQPFIDAPTA